MQIPRIEVGSEAQSSAALSLAAGLVQLLTLKKIITKDDALELYRSLAQAKHSKGDLHSSAGEHEAGDLLDHLANRLEAHVENNSN